MAYLKDRSVCYNMAHTLGLGEERFDYFHAKKIVKTLRKDRYGIAYDVVLGDDGDTVAIVSVKFIEGGFEIMVSQSSLRELSMTFKDVIDRGLEAEWVAANATYFSSENGKLAAIVKAAVCLRKEMKGV